MARPRGTGVLGFHDYGTTSWLLVRTEQGSGSRRVAGPWRSRPPLRTSMAPRLPCRLWSKTRRRLHGCRADRPRGAVDEDSSPVRQTEASQASLCLDHPEADGRRLLDVSAGMVASGASSRRQTNSVGRTSHKQQLSSDHFSFCARWGRRIGPTPGRDHSTVVGDDAAPEVRGVEVDVPGALVHGPQLRQRERRSDERPGDARDLELDADALEGIAQDPEMVEGDIQPAAHHIAHRARGRHRRHRFPPRSPPRREGPPDGRRSPSSRR